MFRDVCVALLRVISIFFSIILYFSQYVYYVVKYPKKACSKEYRKNKVMH